MCRGVCDYWLLQPVGHFSHCLEGTVKYLPPENFRCLQRNEKGLYLSPLKDSWALGVVLFKVWCYNILPYGIDGLKEDDVAGKNSRMWSSCSLPASWLGVTA